MSYYPMTPLEGYDGFGAVSSFNAAAVWADWVAGAKDNAAGKRSADAIRAALGSLGYGPFTFGVPWTQSTDSEYGRFATENGVPKPAGLPMWWPSKVGLIKLGERVAQGGTPGGGTPQLTHVVGGEVVPGGGPGGEPAKADISTGLAIGIGAVALIGIGIIAVMAKKKGDQKHVAKI